MECPSVSSPRGLSDKTAAGARVLRDFARHAPTDRWRGAEDRLARARATPLVSAHTDRFSLDGADALVGGRVYGTDFSSEGQQRNRLPTVLRQYQIGTV